MREGAPPFVDDARMWHDRGLFMNRLWSVDVETNANANVPKFRLSSSHTCVPPIFVCSWKLSAVVKMLAPSFLCEESQLVSTVSLSPRIPVPNPMK